MRCWLLLSCLVLGGAAQAADLGPALQLHPAHSSSQVQDAENKANELVQKSYKPVHSPANQAAAAAANQSAIVDSAMKALDAVNQARESSQEKQQVDAKLELSKYSVNSDARNAAAIEKFNAEMALLKANITKQEDYVALDSEGQGIPLEKANFDNATDEIMTSKWAATQNADLLAAADAKVHVTHVKERKYKRTYKLMSEVRPEGNRFEEANFKNLIDEIKANQTTVDTGSRDQLLIDEIQAVNQTVDLQAVNQTVDSQAVNQTVDLQAVNQTVDLLAAADANIRVMRLNEKKNKHFARNSRATHRENMQKAHQQIKTLN